MSLIIKSIIFFFSITIFSSAFVSAEELKKIGKFKDWETLVLIKDSGLTCFVQTKPVLQSPKANKREARLFVSFRPNDKVVDETLYSVFHQKRRLMSQFKNKRL